MKNNNLSFIFLLIDKLISQLITAALLSTNEVEFQ